jgi:deoxyribose-phosphate aldolase
MDTGELAGRIDLSFLKVDSSSTVQSLKDAVAQVEQLGLRSLVVTPLLAGTVRKNHPQIKVCGVIAYPLGAETLAAKVFTTEELIEQRIEELDVVLDLFAIVNDNKAKVEREARELLDVAKPAKVPLKTIIETPILTQDQIRWVTELMCDVGVDCIKTSTGFHRDATKVEDVRLIKEIAGGRCFIKASGGVRSHSQAIAMLEAGADVIGASDAATILAAAAAS